MKFSWILNLFYCMASLGTILKATTTATQGFCFDHGYTPKDGHRTPNANPGYKYFPGAVMRYSCNKYFELQPSITMQECKKNGTAGYEWIPELPPKCVESVQCHIPIITHGSYDKEVYHKGDELHVTCDNGYTLAEDNKSICLGTGEWSYLPMCKESYCPVPPSIKNGFLYHHYPSLDNGEFPPESHVTYTCLEGYQLEPVSQKRRECREGHWTGVDPVCVQEGCDPPEPSTGEYIPKRPHYDVQDTLTYLCHSNHDVTRSCQPDHTWSGSPCVETLTSVQMPYSSSQVYCARPSTFDGHLNVKCCGDDELDTEISKDPRVCCHDRGLVKFTCDQGFSIDGQPNQWMCSSGDWVAVAPNNLETITVPPECFRNETRGNSGAITDDMLKPVLGTAAGVLVILSAAILIAFCRPKLIDMKRRWRELREDEDELIIDGRRILLPSYEEAVTSHDPYQQQESCPSSSQSPINCDDDTPGPSRAQSRTYVRNNSSSSSNASREQSRPSCSSDEEMLVPEPRNQQQDGEENSSRPQSLVLKAGTSVDACVVINPPPSKQTKPDANNQEQSTPMAFSEDCHICPADGSFTNLRVEDDPILNLGNEAEINLESIIPQTPPEISSKTQIRPVVSNDGSHLLSYPLVSDDNPSNNLQFTIHINSNGTSTNSNELPRNKDEQCCVDILAEDTEHSSKEHHDQDEDSHLSLQSSDQIHIVMSSQATGNRQKFDEMGSTAV